MASKEGERAHDRIVRVFSLCVGVAGLLFTSISYPVVPTQWGIAAPWWTVLASTVVLLPYLVLAVGSFLVDTRWLTRAAAVLVFGYAPVLALVPLAYPQDVFLSEFDAVWALSMVSVVIAAEALVLRRAPAVLVGATIAGTAGLAFWWTYAGASALWLLRTSLLHFVFGLMFAGIAALAMRGARTLDRDTWRLGESVVRRMAAEARLTERGRLDALIHDTVLSALLAGGWAAAPDTVRGSAELALRTLGTMADTDPAVGHVDGAELVARLRQVGAEIDDEVTFELRRIAPHTQVEVAVARVLQEIVGEALRNSIRHAAVPGREVRRWVEVSIDHAWVSVVVGDDGAGFDPARVAPQRLGISMGMRARIAEIPGGAVTIRSAPGEGTEVRATAPADAHAELRSRPSKPADVELEVATAPEVFGVHTVPMVLLLGAWGILQATQPWLNPVPGLLGVSYFGAIAALLAGIGVLLTRGPDPMPWRPAAVAVTLLVLAAIFNTAAASGPYEYGLSSMWSWSAITISLAMLCLRGRVALALATAAAVAAVYLVWATQPATQFEGDFLAGLLASKVILICVCALFAWFARHHVERLNVTRRLTVAVAAQNAVVEARLRERDEQLRYLHSTAGPLLKRMSNSGVLDPVGRQQSLLLEARLRDRIRARALATVELLDAAEAARAAGAQVVLLDDGALEPTDPVLGRIIAIAAAALRDCGEEKVTVRLLPPGRDALCTIVRSGDDSYERIELVAADAPDLVTARQTVR